MPRRRFFTLPAFSGRRARQEMDEEIRFHLDTRAAQFRERGYSDTDAMAEARRRFGTSNHAVTRLERSATRRERRMQWNARIDALRQDVRYALRGIRRAPGFAAAVIATLALGIGANTAIFSVVHGALLSPLPYGHPDRVVQVWNHWRNWPRTWLSRPEVYDYAQDSAVFSSFAAYTTGAVNITGGGDAERVNAGFIQASLFDVAGVHPYLGRAFTAAEDRPNGPRAVILLEDFWRRRYAGDPSIVGRTILVNDQPYTVVGIVPRDFRLPLQFAGDHAQLLLPIQLGPVNESERGGHDYDAMARLAPGITLARAQQRLDARIARIKRQYPAQYGAEFGATLVPVADQVRGDVRPVLYVLLGAVSFVLLIACANVASLFVARAEARSREIAVRAALGAGRARLASQFITECLVLAVCGGALGLAFAFVFVRAITHANVPNLPRLDAIAIDGPVLAFTLGVSIVTGLLFACAPIFQLGRGTSHDVLKQGRGNTSARGRIQLRQLLVSVELALAVVALTGSALMTRSFVRLMSVPPGFTSEGVLTMRLAPPAAKYASSSSVRAFYAGLLSQIRAVPGVASAGATMALPLTTTIGDWNFDIGGAAHAGPDAQSPAADWLVVTDGYFAALGLPMLRGRAFTDADRLGAPPVVVITAATGRKYFAGTNPVGQQIRLSGSADSVWRTIVGVAGDVHFNGLDKDARPTMYLPLAQFPATAPDSDAALPRSLSLAIRATTNPAKLASSIRIVVHRADPDVPVADVRSLDAIVGRSVSTPRMATVVLLVFGLLSLALAAVGVYAVMAYIVAQRTSEIGIRVALGARTADVMRLVLWQGVRPALVGLAAGTIIAAVGVRTMRSILYGVSATDPVAFAGAIIALSIVAFLANWRPARRAAAVDPIQALRSE